MEQNSGKPQNFCDSKRESKKQESQWNPKRRLVLSCQLILFRSKVGFGEQETLKSPVESSASICLGPCSIIGGTRALEGHTPFLSPQHAVPSGGTPPCSQDQQAQPPRASLEKGTPTVAGEL